MEAAAGVSNGYLFAAKTITGLSNTRCDHSAGIWFGAFDAGQSAHGTTWGK